MWRVLTTFGPKMPAPVQAVVINNPQQQPVLLLGPEEMSSIEPKIAPRANFKGAHWPRTSTLQKQAKQVPTKPAEQLPEPLPIKPLKPFNSDTEYKLIRLLGSGGFGEAYYARKRSSGSHSTAVVLKRMRVSEKHQHRRLLWARREAAILAALYHPHIVRYLHAFEEANQVVIEMEYCEGGDLRAFLRSRNGVLLPEKQIRHWFHQLTQAVCYIHEQNIIHRDIKTKNVFIAENGRSLKLGDFGSAKCLVDRKTNEVSLARTRVGTSSHHPPEFCRKQRREYGAEVDAWAMGVLLFELTTLRMPFEAKTQEELTQKILRCSRDHDIDASQYSRSLRRLVDLLMAYEPEDRPTMRQVLDDRYFVTYKRFRRRVARHHQRHQDRKAQRYLDALTVSEATRSRRSSATSSLQGHQHLPTDYYHPSHFQHIPAKSDKSLQNHEALLGMLGFGQHCAGGQNTGTSGIASASGSVGAASPVPPSCFENMTPSRLLPGLPVPTQMLHWRAGQPGSSV